MKGNLIKEGVNFCEGKNMPAGEIGGRYNPWGKRMHPGVTEVKKIMKGLRTI